MLVLGKAERSLPAARARLARALSDGSALERFCRMVRAHGGDVRAVEDPDRLPRAKARALVLAPRAGFVTDCDAFLLGSSAVRLGAGRTRAEQAVDPSAGIELCAGRGERVTRSQPIAVIHARSKGLAQSEVAHVGAAFRISARAPQARRVVLERIGR
jgi:thymidine phosphorylase